MRTRILFVDDDQRELQRLQTILEPLKPIWDMVFMQNSREALALISKTRFDVVVCDLVMPEIDGVEFLAQVMKRHPHTVRFVFADKTDSDTFVRTISSAHQYLLKSSTLPEIKERIMRAITLRNSLSGENLRKLVARLQFLPSLPDLYLRVMQEIESPAASLAKVGELISRDLGMSAKVLKLVNSAYFGLPQHIASPGQAVSLLGLDVVRAMILMLDVMAQFERIRSILPSFSLEGLLDHSFRVASYAKAIAVHENLSDKTARDSMMAGLFHDIGKLILIANLPHEYMQALSTARAKKVAVWLAEWSVFGSTHAEVGAYLLGLWGFPNPIVEACAFHHQPSLDLQQSISTITAIHVANVFEHEFSPSKLNATASKIDLNYLRGLKLEDRLQKWHDICQQMPLTQQR